MVVSDQRRRKARFARAHERHGYQTKEEGKLGLQEHMKGMGIRPKKKES
jgi:hypothetical protein